MAGKGPSHSVGADIGNIREILGNYDYGFPILKELIQNADDAKAQELSIGLIPGFPDSSHPLLRGPLLFVLNDGPFTKLNSHSLKTLGISDKPADFSAVGKYGIGLKSLFHLCEAFFFMGADDSGSASGCDIFNPWSPEQDSDDKQYHGDWDDAAIGYDELVAFLGQLLPDGPWSRGDSGWFCIWVPLRKKIHCAGIDALEDCFPGDQEDPLKGILPENVGNEFSSILPMLLNLRSIRIWNSGLTGTPTLSSEFVLSDDSTRSSWNRSDDQFLNEPILFSGRILEAGLVESVSVFAGIEVCPEHLALAEYKQAESWPKRRGLNDTGTGVDVKEKAAPHAMVCFTRHPDSSGNGSLTTVWSVFLPLGVPDISKCDIPLKISLSLHGYFFIDSGRTEIDVPTNLNVPMTIRQKWNNDLRGEVLLPQILPALESFTEAAALSDEEISALTSSLSRSVAGDNQYRSKICTDVNWVYRILNEDSSWCLIKREHPILRVPEGSPELICSVFPTLTSGSSGEYAIVPGARPSFANQSANRWPGNLLQASLNPPLSIFDDSDQLEYFCEFIDLRRSEIGELKICHDQLVDLVREVIGSFPLDQLLNRKDEMRKIISLIPNDRIFPISNYNSPVRNLVVNRIAGLETDALFVPEELVSESDLSNGEQFSLSITDAQKILNLLSDPPNDWVGTGYDRFRSNFATRILSGVGGESKNLLEICRSYRLFLGQYVGGRGPAVFSYQELVEIPDDLLIFSGTEHSLAEKLNQSLGHTEIVLIPRTICSAIFSPDGAPSTCNLDSCIESIIQSGRLSSTPENRIPILDALLMLPLGSVEYDEPSWRKSVRYLLHGDYGQLESNDMLLVDDPTKIDGIWSKLATAALDFKEDNWQVVPSCLANLIARQHFGSLNLGDLNRDSVVQFIYDIGAENISCNLLSASERDQVVREIDDYTVLRDLRIHMDINGDLRSIGSNTFLEDSFPSDDPLTDQVVVIAKSSSNEDLAFRQRNLVEMRLWNPESALNVAMNMTDPSEHALSVVKGLRLVKGQITSELRQSLRDNEWLPTKDSTAVAPGYVVHIRGLESQLAEVSKLSDGAVIDVGSLRSEFSEPDSLEILARLVFLSPVDTLNLIGMALGEIETYRIGLRRDRFDSSNPNNSSNFDTWIAVFENLEEPFLPVIPILSSLLKGANNQFTQSIRTNLVTELLHPIPSTKYLSILNRLAERHQSSDRANRDRLREVHSWYLEESTQAPEFGTTILPELLLQNRSRAWKPSANLCSSVENISDDDVLDDSQFRIIHRYLVDPQIIPPRVNTIPTDQEDDIRTEFIEYIKEWEGSCPPLVLGALVAILGDDDEIRKLSNQLLSEGSRSVDLVRGLFNWRPQPQRSTTGWIASEDINEVMSSQKFIFTLEPGDPGAEVQIKNLLGFDFAAHLSQQISHLIVGESNSDQRLAHSPVNSPITQERTAHIRIRMINPLNFQEQAQEIIKTTAHEIWKGVFLQNGTLSPVWENLGGDDQVGVLAAQTMIQESLFFHMGQLRMPENPTIDGLKNRWDELRRQQQEKIFLDQLGHSSVSRANIETEKANILREMGIALESESGVQESFHQAVVKTVTDHQYGLNSIPFELFQNADDATAQLAEMEDRPIENPFVVVVSDNSLTFVHWGRPINKFRGRQFEQKKYQSDLENMLVMHASGKSSRGDEEEVTGKFGLGFKTVFLACKNPRVLSGTIGFEVVGGVYPKILSSEIRDTLRARVRAANLDPLDATIIDFDLDNSDRTETLDVLGKFRSLVSVLLVFSRAIKTSEMYVGPETSRSSWMPQYLSDVPNVEFGNISWSHENIPVLFFNTPLNSGILFALTRQGLGRLNSSIPSLWVTTPTEEPSSVGFAMNGMFGIDPGRGHLRVRSPETENVIRELGYAAGNHLNALAEKTRSDWATLRSELGLEPEASPYEFWASFWDLLGRGLSETNNSDTSDSQIARRIFWDPDSGALLQTIRTHRVIPSGLSGGYSELISLREIKHQVDGCLSNDDNFEAVSSWPVFKTKHKPGSIISRKLVGQPLQFLLKSPQRYDVIRLKSALQGEFQGELASPELAETIGKTISTDLLNRLEEGNLDEKTERSEIISYLSSLKFQSKSGTWCSPSSLVISEHLAGVDPDEPKRAAFAPDLHVLSSDYHSSGLDFFRLCRRQLEASSEEMADWALQVGNDESKRKSVLDYLLNGALNDPLGGRLHRSIQGTWLGSLDHQSPLMTEYEFFERDRIFGLLRIRQTDNAQIIPGQPTIRLTQRDPTEVLREIFDWWKKNRADEIKIYEESVYPGGVAPLLITDLGVLSHDVASRESWLETFILGSTFTMGRTKAQAHRNFVRQMRNDGWLTKFATPKLDLTEFMKFLEEYFNHPNDRQDYYHWLRQFVSIVQLSRWLDDYAKIFLDLDKRPGFVLHNPLRNRRDYAYDFTGMDAPSLIPALGYGACFIVRELARQKALTSYDTRRYCYVPQARLRNFLGDLGCSGLDDGITTERSTVIFEFLENHLGDDASFEGDFDLPLQIIASGKDDLWEHFLGTGRPEELELEEIDDDE